MRTLFVVLLVFLLNLQSHAETTQPKSPTGKICVATDGEELRVRRKCKSSEAEMSVSNLKGINLASCRTVIAQNTEISGLIDITKLSLGCNPNEFLLTHAGSTSDTTTSVISVLFLYYSGEVFPSGVDYYFGRLEPTNTTTVTSFAAAVCCAR